MNNLPAQVIEIVTKELSDSHLFATLPELTADTMLDKRWFGPVDRCCVAIELDEVFGIEIADAALESWQSVSDIIASVKRLVGVSA